MNNVGDIIRLEEGKAIILGRFDDNNIKYLFVNIVSEDETTNTQDFYLLIDNKDNTFTKIVDENEVNRLMPKVQAALLHSMEDMGIDPNSTVQQ